MGSTGVGAVTATVAPARRARSRLVPVKTMAGWSASGITPAARAGAKTPYPCSGAVCSAS